MGDRDVESSHVLKNGTLDERMRCGGRKSERETIDKGGTARGGCGDGLGDSRTSTNPSDPREHQSDQQAIESLAETKIKHT